MAKPASGASLNTGHSLYTSMSMCIALLEGTGTTAADSVAGTHNGTIGSSSYWATVGGDAVIQLTSPVSNPIAIASPFSFDGTQPYSFAWRAKRDAADNLGMVFGDKDDTANFVWMDEANTKVRLRSGNSTDYDFTTSGMTTAKDYLLVYDRANTKMRLYVDGTQVGTGVTVSADANATFSLDCLGNGYGAGNTFAFEGDIHYLYVWTNRALDGTDATTLDTDPYAIFGSTDPISLTEPDAYQVYQRDQAGKADMVQVGTYFGSPTAIESSWAGGAYVTTVGTPAASIFTSKLGRQATGNGTFTARWTNTTSNSASVSNVNVGDLFAIAGQSNASGRGTNNQSYTGTAGWAGLFGNDNLWKALADPTDSNTNQVDSVSSDGSAAGSPWPLLASTIVGTAGIPVGFVPCALGGTSVTQWKAGADPYDRSTLFGSMAYRVKVASGCRGCRAVIFILGETDAGASMSAATFYGHAITVVSDVRKWIGCPTVFCKIGTLSGSTAINTAIQRLWDECADALPGATLPDYDSSPHWVGNTALADVASAIWSALQPLFYASTGGGTMYIPVE
jgi:hypothetical protein